MIREKFIRLIKAPLFIVCALGFALLAVPVVLVYDAFTPTTSLWRYDKIVGDPKRKEAGNDRNHCYFDHFPERIPSSASDAMFYRFGFRGAQILLLLTLSSAETSKIEQRLRAEHQALSADMAISRPYVIPKEWCPRSWFGKEPSYESRKFGDDFIWFDLSPARDPKEPNGNFFAKGVAVSQSKHQVLYWLID
ncbi:hypothetical protein [Prosthecobacter sp.]|uniref:hypothetical protein n=1 Tax=Prosthecobacter sp. TaxID=1965333 RepID=UPI002ABCF1C0|nr:hypothetical protein [Prosthecobacter sp.]MDZ4406278.1 hypothetical protein [Prosthecobacter sp.]